MKRMRTIAVLPTLFTLGNLTCGFFAIVVAARIERPGGAFFNPTDPTNIMISAMLIFLAMAFDAFDGQLARLSKTNSEFGEQLDSLCDLVSFGVAPAFLLVKMCPNFTYVARETVWIISALFVACAALRLARFNVETDANDDHMHFRGLPSPAAAATIASFAVMFHALRVRHADLEISATIDGMVQMVLPYFALVVALLMVTRIPYPHVVNQVFRGQRSFAHLVWLLFAAVLVALLRGYSLPILCAAFVLASPLRYFWDEFVLRRPHDEPII